MIVMPANSSGWLWHSLARETRRLGHLHSPGRQARAWPWFPYALDNGAFSCWDPKTNAFDEAKWKQTEIQWKHMLFWAQTQTQKPLWAIVPDRPGHAEETFRKWFVFAGIVEESGFPLALAVQDGMTPDQVRALTPSPEVICVGGSTKWKWDTVEMWAKEFERVHLLRCNMPGKLEYLDGLGIESCDGSGWGRDRVKLEQLEKWARSWNARTSMPLWPHACRQELKAKRQFKGQPVQSSFA